MARKPVQLTCQHCGERFETREHQKNRPRKFCDRRCRDAARSTRVLLTCRQCGEDFERKAYMEAWSRVRGPFCGFRCYGAWQKAHVTRAANPTWKPNGRESRHAQEQRAAAMERDRHRCVGCGSAEMLHVHHVEHFATGQPDPHALGNLETLCASCHRHQHPVPHGPDGRFVAR